MSRRKEVLNLFKRLHRTRVHVFYGDQHALTAARAEINSKFRSSREITDAQEIQKLIQLGEDVEKELRTNVIQAVQKEEGVYEARIREDVVRLDNVIFNPDAVIEKPRRGAARCDGAPKTEKT